MGTFKRTVATPALAALSLVAASLAHAGPGIAVAAEMGPVTCSGGLTSVEIDVAVTAGAAAPFTMQASTGGDFANLGTYSNWASYGKTKGAEESFQVTLPIATSAQVTVCVAQPGNGSPQACTAVSLPAMCDGGSGSDRV